MSDQVRAGWAWLVRQTRTKAGLLQVDYAERIGASQPLVSMWERGISTPSARFQAAIVSEFDVAPDELAKVYRGEAVA